MKCMILFAVVLEAASAQFQGSLFSKPLSRQPPRPFKTSPPTPKPYVAPRPARPASGSDQAANIVRYDNEVNPDGSFNYAVETDNGISAQAQGTPRDFGGNPPLVPVVIQGSFSYTSPEGQPIVISYVADENGYQPQGDSLPTPPPVPPQIARALEYLAKQPIRK